MKNTSVTPSATFDQMPRPEPQHEDRRQHHARQGVEHLDVGIEDRRQERLARQPEAEHDAGGGADDEGQHALRSA